MRLAFFSPVLNNHQIGVADALWRLLGDDYRFVELANLNGDHKKGDERNYGDCPFLIQAWRSKAQYEEAMHIARESDCCVFGGVLSLPFMKVRLAEGKLSFDMSERWLKRGLINVFSPTIAKYLMTYKVRRWESAPLYKLCCSGFAAGDQERLATYVGKCYKWGYFTAVNECTADFTAPPHSMMWCSRFLEWKHPELPVLMARELTQRGYRIHLDMYGDGPMKEKTIMLSEKLGLSDIFRYYSSMPNSSILAEMRNHGVFFFTSDRNEGWGAVANESMSNGCLLVTSDSIGSTPFLLEDGKQGLVFRGPRTSSSMERPDVDSLKSLIDKTVWLLDHPKETDLIRRRGHDQIKTLWSPKVAAERLLALSERLLQGKDTEFTSGPCSKA